MGDTEGFDVDYDLPGGSFSRLLFAADDISDHPTPLFSTNTPKMLRFGDYLPETTAPRAPFSDSSASSSGNDNSKKKRNGSGSEFEKGGGPPVNGKKNRPQGSTGSAGHAKGKKEKLGERIAALQQLVSPHGKTDTATVLHEALGYIRFLHDQVKVLCSAYLHRLPHHPSSIGEEESKKREIAKGLKNQGLCLVPMECIAHVASANGADLWSPAMNTTTTTKP